MSNSPLALRGYSEPLGCSETGPGPPKVYQLQELPTWEEIVLRITFHAQPACMAFTSACSPQLLVLNQTALPSDIYLYNVVYVEKSSEEPLLVDVIHMELDNFSDFETAWAKVERALSGPKRHSEPFPVASESPEEHRARGLCPYCRMIEETGL